ncbi:pyridine nucleotide-disulfide oxidoreductase [Paractinoplanes deccanensis]|uniref:Pyridine nucleotide-disulfide oxidoreductase n=1 Tax=Paractinoplanes deccanensis TaxID=113561 RepID=A0ABQ3Y3U8_9ACTN|nr:NAD(P)-binding domain-containing protein [Actinoplanes deccanensis]GID74674.1 pyridine nucleotide-disulfide oxidoreductase [Actinoplanes deccanensis]
MTHDYLIIGAGPAGLQLAALMERDGHDYVVLEAGETAGTFFRTYPRHRRLISINKVWTGSDDPEFNLRADWNSLLTDDPARLFRNYSTKYFPAAGDMVRYLADFAEGLNIEYGVRVTSVSRPADFVVTAGDRTYSARRVIVATGVSRLYEPPIPGASLAERYDTVSVDAAGFTNQRVLIIGKGNSAFETADALVETAAVIHVAGPHSVRLAWQTHYVGHLRAVNNNFLDTYQLKSQNAVLDGTVERIARRDDGGYRVDFRYARTVEKTRVLDYDRIILCTGFAFDASIFDPSAAPALVINDRFPEQTAAFESVNVPGLYFAGTLSQQRDFKKSTNGFIHGFRYGVRALHKILSARYESRPWPAAALEPTPEAITAAVIARINRTSALWQQFAVLADVVTVSATSSASSSAAYHEEVPVAYFKEGALTSYDVAFVVTLEYGPDHDQVDPFDITVPRIAENDAAAAHEASYLHPVVRAYRGGTVVATHHLAENLENNWDLPGVHVEPLEVFVKGVLADVA